jgi:hypothetical protein
MSALVKLLNPSLNDEINFSNPLKSRQWLKLLVPDREYGLKFKPNLNLTSERLGFSFQSNHLGLRGPAATNGAGVVLGTSFAMGLSVDNGRNWYDLLLEPSSWFNGSMPVGPENSAAVLDSHYVGQGNVLLYLYHPNIWRIAQGFVAAKAAGRDIFEHLRWDAAIREAIARYPVWVTKQFAASISGYAVYRRWDGRDFYFNARYNWFDPLSGVDFAISQMQEINKIFSRFDRVIVVRTPIKEDSLPDERCSPKLLDLRANYEQMWKLFCDCVLPDVHCYRLDHAMFTARHFHALDTHWSVDGNALFAHLLADILCHEGIEKAMFLPGERRKPDGAGSWKSETVAY